jgi:uncharacterized protein YbjT (DUF2867 family)
MKILVVGASGRTGHHLLKHLLRGGHDVTAFVRNPASLSVQHARLEIVQGEARDAASLDLAVKGHDAVACAFGPVFFKEPDIHEVFMRNLVAAITKHNVKRLVNVSGRGVGDSLASMPFPFRTVIAPVLLRSYLADKARGETHLFESSIEYVNVRPGRLLNVPARGGVKASLDGEGLKPEMSREDLALFMIAQLQSAEWVRKSPIIGY